MMSRKIRCSNCVHARMVVGKIRRCVRPGAKENERVKASRSCTVHQHNPIVIHQPGPRTMQADGRGGVKTVIGKSKKVTH
jgi:hypothetical protein